MKIPFISREKKELTPTQRSRRLVGQLIFKVVLIFMAAVAIIYGVYAYVSGSALFIPRSAGAVLASAETPPFYSWSSESVRMVVLGGKRMQQDAVRGATVDLQNNHFQLETAGVLAERTIFVSDGEMTIALDESSQADNTGWRMVTDACHGKPGISAETLQFPPASQLAKENPEILSDQGSILGEQAWVLSFDPSPETIEQLLWVPFFGQVLSQRSPSELDWAISDQDRAALEAGDYKVDYGRIWVTRNKPRMVAQIDTRFTINSTGAQYRLLAQMVQNNGDKTSPLASTDLGEPSCASGGGAAPQVEEQDLPSVSAAP